MVDIAFYVASVYFLLSFNENTSMMAENVSRILESYDYDLVSLC